jgi:hypothetical protein
MVKEEESVLGRYNLFHRLKNVKLKQGRLYTFAAVYNQKKHREISGSHGSEYEDGCLLGCCTV